MVIDTSVFVAILLKEPDAAAFKRTVLSAPLRLAGAVSKLESSMVIIGRFGATGLGSLDRLLAELNVTIVPFDEHQADIARAAFARYGKGRHPAELNFGDCAAYALAMAEAEPLLFKGTDFGATDVEAARAM